MKVLLIILACLGLTACWEQNEVISIDGNGHMRWLIVAEPLWEYSTQEEVEQLLEEYIDEARTAGWNAKLSKPPKLGDKVVVALEGNLLKVAVKTSFYNVISRDSEQVKLRFLCPMYVDDTVRREIKLKSTRRGVDVFDARGNELSVMGCADEYVVIHLKS